MNITGTSPILPNAINPMQAVNLMAMQNIQNYLKLFVFNINVAQQGQSSTILQPDETGLTMTPLVQMTTSTTPETKYISLSEKIDRIPLKTTRMRTQKSSGLLWNLMANKYSKKLKSADEEIDPKECQEDGETFRKVNGVYVPVLKNLVPTVKRQNTCGHPEKNHYARGLCSACYHRVGRGKKPWNCNHEKLYALGLCHKCYTAKNRQMRKNQIKGMNPDQVKQENGESDNEGEMEVEVKEEF